MTFERGTLLPKVGHDFRYELESSRGNVSRQKPPLSRHQQTEQQPLSSFSHGFLPFGESQGLVISISKWSSSGLISPGALSVEEFFSFPLNTLQKDALSHSHVYAWSAQKVSAKAAPSKPSKPSKIGQWATRDGHLRRG
jgi:hypothetical protein